MKEKSKKEKQIDLAIEKARREERRQSRFYISSFDYGKGFRAGIDYQKKLVNDEENPKSIIKSIKDFARKHADKVLENEKQQIYNHIHVDIKDPFQQNYNCDDKFPDFGYGVYQEDEQ